jgi:RNA polymerase sigma factor (TIGR02999 family)
VSEVSRILKAVDDGDPRAAAELLPLVYAELRRLAAGWLDHEKPGQTLQPTALVHEAYLRLVGAGDRTAWQGRAHFFAAAAEAMRRILLDRARRKGRLKHGGRRARVKLPEVAALADESAEDLLALDEALTRFAAEEPRKAELVKLHYFAGLSVEEAGALLGLSRATATRHLTYARAWLYEAMTGEGEDPRLSRPS